MQSTHSSECEDESDFVRDVRVLSSGNWWLETVPIPGGLKFSVLDNIAFGKIPLNPCKVRGLKDK